VPIRVRKGLAVQAPVGIGRGDRRVPRPLEALNRTGPGRLVWKVEDKQVILGGGLHRVPGLPGELQVVPSARMAQHHAIKARMIGELIEEGKPEAVTIEAQDAIQVAGGTGNANVRGLQGDRDVHCRVWCGWGRALPTSPAGLGGRLPEKGTDAA
jgi:hypothetical protein